MFKNSVWYIGLYFVIICGNMAWYRYWFWFLKTVQNNGFFWAFYCSFYHTMLCRAWYCHGKSSIRPHVC